MGRIRLLFAADSVAAEAGTERQIAELIRRLDATRFEKHLCCLEESERLRDLAKHCEIRVFPTQSVFSANGLRQMLHLRRYIKRHNVEIVQTFMVKATIAATLAAWGSGCRAVVASRRNMGYWHTPFLRLLFRFLNRRTTRLLANSEGARRIVIETERVPPDQVDVLYNGVDMERYSPDFGEASSVVSADVSRQREKVVGIVANLRPVKGIDLFLRAARIVAAQVPEAVFLVVGQGPLRAELGQLSAELGITEKVQFTDGRGVVADHLRSICIGCLSSKSEGFSNAILEYMAAGLPVVATDVGGNAEAVEHGVTGYIVSGREPERFAEPIIELLKDDAKRVTMGRLGRERCRVYFDIVAAVERHEQYYTALFQKVYG